MKKVCKRLRQLYVTLDMAVVVSDRTGNLEVLSVAVILRGTEMKSWRNSPNNVKGDLATNLR
jgi:hypothetical protein